MKLTTITVVGAIALGAPAVSAAQDTSSSTPTPSQQCKSERTAMGKEAFGLLYGTNKTRSNAFGKCVSKRAKATESAEKAARTNAAKECDAERTADPAAFKTKYGTGKNGANAYGKCVSTKAKAKTTATVKAQVKSEINAAKTCKALRKNDKAAFEQKYGTARNAFGKCVSATAKAKSQTPTQS